MTDEVGAGRSGSGTERQDWDDGDEEASALLKTVGRQLKLWREQAGMTQAELGAAIGYSEEQVSSVERGRRAPKAEFLRAADEALGAGGILVAFAEDVARAKYPKKVRDLAKLEDEAVEIGAYSAHNIQGLLQTEEYARALFRMRRPVFDSEHIETQVAARLARQEIFKRWPSPILSFVQEEVTLRRTLGGRGVQRKQLERLLEVGQLRNVEIQVMPTVCEDHAGMGGQFRLLSARNGSKAAHLEVQQLSRVLTEPKDVQLLETRYGIIRAQALTPRESLAFIEKALGET
ncbi:helix-turn-helix domain-containing protein [Streptomyces sp. NPDC051561]|uniref:helix-turn-helix domain-containing protein n=1 Tax=Streptomyces sp. NPDC051561 TaxID=3365658 RepID=UPI00378E43BB